MSLWCWAVLTLWSFNIAIEHGHLNCGFTQWKWWFFIAMSVSTRGYCISRDHGPPLLAGPGTGASGGWCGRACVGHERGWFHWRVPGVAVGSKDLLVICKSYRKSMNISLFTQLLDRLSIYIYIYKCIWMDRRGLCISMYLHVYQRKLWVMTRGQALRYICQPSFPLHVALARASKKPTGKDMADGRCGWWGLL